MTKTAAGLVADAREQVDSLDPEEVAQEVADGALIVDLRELEERVALGAIPGSLHVPRGLLEFKADPTAPAHLPELDPMRRTILYCASGGRSALAAVALRQLGYVAVAHLEGGLQAWHAAGRSTATSHEMGSSS